MPQRLLRLAATICLLLAPAAAIAQQPDIESVVANVADAVCDKRIVLLGELPSHGEARAFEAKAGIVRRLVERCGFDAVLFEAPIYDFIGFAEDGAQYERLAAQLDRAIGRFWLTRELADWRAWLFSRATEGGLVVGGVDDQVSVTSDYARATLPSLVAAASPRERAAACEETVARHLWRYDAATLFDEAEQARLQRCARQAADAAAPADGSRRTSRQVMLENLANYMDRQVRVSGAPDRDAAMFPNTTWHLERLPAGSRVVIWTATVHASRARGSLPSQPLGAWLVGSFGAEVAAVGFTALGGSSSMAGQPPKPLAEAPAGSLEARALEGGAPFAFLTAADLRRIGSAPSRLFGRLAEADWSALFDAVVVIREEVPPTFVSN